MSTFREYWRTIQAQQSAVLARTQDAYASLMKKLQEVWNEEPVRARFADRCRGFATALREASATPGDPQSMEAAYREYVEQLRDAWTEAEVQQRIEDVYLSMTEEIQRVTEQSQQKLEEARRSYLERMSELWGDVGPDDLDAAVLAKISRNMMVTVFFTDGMRPPEAAVPAAFT